MIRNTEEYDGPYKISISLENVMDSHVKQHFERGLDALLADPHFMLLYVPENGDKMRIIRPVEDPHHRKRMVERINEAKGVPSFYYALSHLWGITERNRHMWEEIGEYVDDVNGEPVAPVSMRPEKRDTLLGLLKDHLDSYWWIDVLCARTDTPLDIMGDIYSCCFECIAMIDCDPNLLSKLHTEKNARKELFALDWIRALHGKSEDPDYILHCKQIHDKYPQLFDDLLTLRQSEWWERVWTWQEMALPFGAVRLMAEVDTHRFQSNTITIDDLVNTFINATDIMVHLSLKGCRFLLDWMAETNHARAFNKQHCDKNERANQFGALFYSLYSSTRRCMDPVDYVYGILGMLKIKIPRMTDPEAVWHRFLFELDNYMDMMGTKTAVFRFSNGSKSRISVNKESAHEIVLQEATCMADVYKGLLCDEKF
ncbi:hypothetical protein K492DRAFT_198712 [Lichtheimia hyalospora FSU 10163]|nr:hypothetical protein K492DRAFT_198712 [Lichtheimia hyalospora FSU 10163]